MKLPLMGLLFFCLFCTACSPKQQQGVVADFVTITPTLLCTLSPSTNKTQEKEYLNRFLTEAQKLPPFLDIDFIMQDEPIEHGILVFQLKDQETRSLTLHLIDEEYLSSSSCSFLSAPVEHSYGVDVSQLESGNYILVLKDEEGKELQRKVDIAHITGSSLGG